MKLGSNIFINNGLKVESEAPNEYLGLSKNMLIGRLDEADQAIIISAYYDLCFLKQLFEKKRKLKFLTMIFARASSSALPNQVRELCDFQGWLKEKFGRSTTISIKIASGRRFLHTKLYHFRRGKWARTLVGSANATDNGFSRNDELLIELHGRDQTIEGYIEWTDKHASKVDDSSLDGPETYDSLQAILRDGFVYFKTYRNIPYTLDCFDNQPAISDKIQKAVVVAPLPFHDEQSAGVLNLLKLLNVGAANDRSDPLRRVRIVPYTIETCFGYWVPVAFNQRLNESLELAAERRTSELLAYGRQLGDIVDAEILTRIRKHYLDQVDSRITAAGAQRLRATVRLAVEDRVLRRIQNLRTLLTSEEQCKRLAKPLSGTAVPEIWEDPRSKGEMVDSFCEYISWRLARPSKVPGIVRTLQGWFDLRVGDMPEEVHAKIQKLFDSGKSLSRVDWTSRADFEDAASV